MITKKKLFCLILVNNELISNQKNLNLKIMFCDRKKFKTSWNFSDPDQKETDPQHWFLGRTLNWESGLSLKKSFF